MDKLTKLNIEPIPMNLEMFSENSENSVNEMHVLDLHLETGADILDCRAALKQVNGDKALAEKLIKNRQLGAWGGGKSRRREKSTLPLEHRRK